MSEFLAGLLEANIAAATVIAIVLVARGWVRRRWGAHAAYLMWAIVPVATLATLIPARTVVIEAPTALLAFDVPVGAFVTPGSATWIETALSVLPWLWMVGLTSTMAWLLLGQARFLGDVRRGKAGPAVVGLLRPHIVIPSDFGGRFEAREQELILAHERFHLARHDARLNTLVALARCVCWFNPMIHVGAHVMRIDQELSCDAAVVGRRPGARRTYAETLLKTQLAARPLPLGCYWPAGTQHPLTERIAMLTRTSPSRRTRLLASAAVAMLAAGGGVATWAAQPERTVLQEAPLSPAEKDARRHRVLKEVLEKLQATPAQFVPVPQAPRAPRAPPAPAQDFFVPVPPAPVAPLPAPARDFFVPVPETPQAQPAQPAPPAPALQPLRPVAPLAAPAPLEAPQELTQAERDALMKEMEAQRKQMEVQRAQMEVQRAEFERQRMEMEAQRKELEAQRQQFMTLRDKLNPDAPRPAPSRVSPGELKLDRPLDGAALKKLPPDVQRKLELAYAADGLRFEREQKALKKRDEAVLRNKIVIPGAGPAGPKKKAFKSLQDQLAEVRKAEGLTTDEAAKAKLNEAIRMLEELEKRGPNKAPDAPQ